MRMNFTTHIHTYTHTHTGMAEEDILGGSRGALQGARTHISFGCFFGHLLVFLFSSFFPSFLLLLSAFCLVSCLLFWFWLWFSFTSCYPIRCCCVLHLLLGYGARIMEELCVGCSFSVSLGAARLLSFSSHLLFTFSVVSIFSLLFLTTLFPFSLCRRPLLYIRLNKK